MMGKTRAKRFNKDCRPCDELNTETTRGFNMTTTSLMFATSTLPALQEFVTATKLHPILVNFTAAWVPISVASDMAARFLKNESLPNTGWWTLFYATVIAGWLFWASDENGVTAMTIHKWQWIGLVVLLFGLFAWRLVLHRQHRWATTLYLVMMVIFVASLVYQGYLGGVQVFSGI